MVWKQVVHASKMGWRLGTQIAVMTVARVRRATVAELVTISAVVLLIAMVAHAWRKRYASRTKEATRRAIRSVKANISALYQKYMQRWWLRARATTRAFCSSWYALYEATCAERSGPRRCLVRSVALIAESPSEGHRDAQEACWVRDGVRMVAVDVSEGGELRGSILVDAAHPHDQLPRWRLPPRARQPPVPSAG